MEITQRLKNIRQDHDLTQKEIPDYLKIDIKTYNRIENNKGQLTMQHIVDLAAYYKVTTDYLLGVTDNPDPMHQINKEQLYKAFAKASENEKKAIVALLKL